MKKDGIEPVLLISSLGVALAGARHLMETAAHSPRLPLWDMAKYGVSGLRLQAALSEGRIWQALVEIHQMSVWPPWWPSLSAVAFGLLGPDYSSARILVVSCWVVAVVAAAWAPRPLVGGAEAGALAAAWLAAGPMFQSLATVNLLEVPGLLLLILCLGCYVRAISAADPSIETRWWRATAITSLCLFFCKYNYGLFWLVPMAVSEARRRSGSWAALAQSLRELVPRLPWRRPLWWLLILWVALLSAIRWSGGIELALAGQEIRATSIGNPAYALYLAICCWAFYRYRKGLGFGDFLPVLTRPDRILGRWLVLPVGMWMLLPPHVKELFGFLENRSSDLIFWDGLWFYPDAFLNSYAAHPALGALVLVLAGIGLRDLWSGCDGRRVVALCLAVGVLALLSHPYKLERFAFQTAWLIGLVAALSLTRAKTVLPRGLLFGVALVVLVSAAWVGVDRPFVEHQHRLRTVSEEVQPMLDAFADSAKRRDGGVLVLGTWNGLSPALIEWNARRLDYAASEESAPLPSTGFEQARRRAWRLQKVIDQGDFRWIAVVTAEPGSAFDQETAWLQPIVDGLRASEHYRAVGPSRSAGAYSWQWLERPGLP